MTRRVPLTPHTLGCSGSDASIFDVHGTYDHRAHESIGEWLPQDFSA